MPLAKEGTLEKCIELYTKIEQLDGDNSIYNEKTDKKERAEKQIAFWSLPEVLVITLKDLEIMVEKTKEQ